MNHLSHEKSPYLLQHVDNPVDWYPWGAAAFARAKELDRPMLLSVGYATCHWCHVMAHESFEDPSMAEVINAHFVAVKVDREERPDVDGVYMAAVQATSGHGGWPMTVFMTPDGRPFYCGTYFPPDDRWGRPGFRRILTAIADAWRDRRADLEATGQSLLDAIAKSQAIPPGAASPELVDALGVDLARAYDSHDGGFGGAPKFPRPMAFSALLRRAVRRRDAEALTMVTHSLDKMARGGLCDQLAGGFARYSTDDRWLVPHFEKMRYDNAQLARAYVEAFLVSGRAELAVVARETLDYLLRDLLLPCGAFASAEDADSEGHEGRFYVWTAPEVEAVLGKDDGAFACRWFGVTEFGNFEGGPEAVLTRAHDPAAVAREVGVTPEEVERRVAEVRQRLLQARAARVRPLLDDKVLTGWNGLAIGALARAARALDEPRYAEAAVTAARFVATTLMREDGSLLRRFRDGEAAHAGTLEDAVLFSDGLLDVFELTGDVTWIERARTLMDHALETLWDGDGGGFFSTALGHDPHLGTRLKEAYDGAMPSGNSAAAHVLLRLFGLTMEPRYRERATQTLDAFARPMARNAEAYPWMVCALDDLLSGPRQIVLVGDPNDAATQALRREVDRRFLPGTVVAYRDPRLPDAALAPIARGRPLVDGQPAAYVCRDFTCALPVTRPEALAGMLETRG